MADHDKRRADKRITDIVQDTRHRLHARACGFRGDPQGNRVHTDTAPSAKN